MAAGRLTTTVLEEFCAACVCDLVGYKYCITLGMFGRHKYIRKYTGVPGDLDGMFAEDTVDCALNHRGICDLGQVPELQMTCSAESA